MGVRGDDWCRRDRDRVARSGQSGPPTPFQPGPSRRRTNRLASAELRWRGPSLRRLSPGPRRGRDRAARFVRTLRGRRTAPAGSLPGPVGCARPSSLVVHVATSGGRRVAPAERVGSLASLVGGEPGRATADELGVRPVGGEDHSWRAAYRATLEASPLSGRSGARRSCRSVFARVRFFAGCTRAELADLVSTAYPIAFEAGEAICSEGTSSGECWVIAEGVAHASIEGEVRRHPRRQRGGRARTAAQPSPGSNRHGRRARDRLRGVRDRLVRLIERQPDGARGHAGRPPSPLRRGPGRRPVTTRAPLDTVGIPLDL